VAHTNDGSIAILRQSLLHSCFARWLHHAVPRVPSSYHLNINSPLPRGADTSWVTCASNVRGHNQIWRWICTAFEPAPTRTPM
jgi:hypothetical protein